MVISRATLVASAARASVWRVCVRVGDEGETFFYFFPDGTNPRLTRGTTILLLFLYRFRATGDNLRLFVEGSGVLKVSDFSERFVDGRAFVEAFFLEFRPKTKNQKKKSRQLNGRKV